MQTLDALEALSALSQESRLQIYSLLVEAGPNGMQAGQIATALDLPPNTLTFHFDRLRHAALVTVRREGRSMIYAARFDTMNDLLGYLSKNCCGGDAQKCAPKSKSQKKTARGKEAAAIR
jgi:DNA-binding transcriptional ArsR family regulator